MIEDFITYKSPAVDKYTIYKSVSDLINDSYDWISLPEHNTEAIQYILGINDFARYLIDRIQKEAPVDDKG